MSTLPFIQPDADCDAPLPDMVGDHPLMREVYRLVRDVASTDATVAIVGETGTGKELVARALHGLSARRRGPFVAVNAAALPETLFESELFGHGEGAFSGAGRPKAGLLETAHGGSFYLDELGSLSAACQAKLLRVVEDGMLRRVGEVRERPAAPRWIVSCQGFDRLAHVGRGIRQDLWHRLSEMIIRLPRLRDRPTDVPLLIGFFSVQLGATSDRLQPSAVDALTQAPWPGNVRELRQVVRRLLAKARGGRVTAELVHAELADDDDVSRRAELADVVATVAACGWDMQWACRLLKMSRATVYRRLREAGAQRPPEARGASHASQRRL